MNVVLFAVLSSVWGKKKETGKLDVLIELKCFSTSNALVTRFRSLLLSHPLKKGSFLATSVYW